MTNWFLAGKTITLETDVSLTDGTGAAFAYPHVVGTDSADYNMSAVLIYVGMARSTSDGVNVAHVDWFNASQSYAKSQCWNMWKAGNPWARQVRPLTRPRTIGKRDGRYSSEYRPSSCTGRVRIRAFAVR